MILRPRRIDQFEITHGVDRAVYDKFLRNLIPTNPSHVLTVGLMPTRRCPSAHRWNADTTSAREQLVYYLIARLDRQLHGRSHHLLTPEEKFDFLILTESSDRFGNTVPAHLHGYLAIPDNLTDAFYAAWCGADAGWCGIDDDLTKKATELKFYPDVMVQEYYVDAVRDGYPVKDGLNNAAEIWTRQTMKPEKKYSSSGCS
jgi:hypothetical protein